MESIKKNKILISVFLITLVLFMYYFFFSGKGSTNISLSDTSGDSQLVGSDVLMKLDQLNSVHIDQQLFMSAAWMSLKDISTPLPSDVPGKSDLFSALGTR